MAEGPIKALSSGAVSLQHQGRIADPGMGELAQGEGEESERGTGVERSPGGTGRTSGLLKVTKGHGTTRGSLGCEGQRA